MSEHRHVVASEFQTTGGIFAVSETAASPQSFRGWMPNRWILGIYASFAMVIVCVLAAAGWGVYVDFEESRKSLLQSEINRLRSHAARTVLRVQSILPAEATESDLNKLKTEPWLRDHWDKFSLLDEARLYSAIIDRQGRIVAHSDTTREGVRLPAGWYTAVVTEIGDDAILTSDAGLTGGATAIDVGLPIEVGGQELGTYHSGFNVAWFEQELATKRAAVLNRWGLTFALIAVIIGLSGVSLLHVTRRISQLQSALAFGHVRRLADLGQLAGGIAHEVRNPLNAIRLNLHMIDRLMKSSPLPDERAHSIINESVREMDRVDGLLRTLLNYARPDKPRSEKLDLTDELAAVADFIRPIIERDGVVMNVSNRTDRAVVMLDRSRFRQIIINLLKNAAEAAAPDGRVDVVLETGDGQAKILIRDTGPGVDSHIKDRIFEPFFTTKDLGTGLGLSLAKRYVEEAGGEILVGSADPNGAEFAVRLPLCSGGPAAKLAPADDLCAN